MLHVAGPESTEWLIEAFHNNGVTDFDLIGISYYWGWHAPATMEDVGELIDILKSRYASKDVMVVETASMWTTEMMNMHPELLGGLDVLLQVIHKQTGLWLHSSQLGGGMVDVGIRLSLTHLTRKNAGTKGLIHPHVFEKNGVFLDGVGQGPQNGPVADLLAHPHHLLVDPGGILENSLPKALELPSWHRFPVSGLL